MFFPPKIRSFLVRSLTAAGAILIAASARAEGDVAIYARAFNGYVRAQLPDHSVKPESYVFVSGGRIGSRAKADGTIDHMTFDQIAHTIAVPLQERAYVPSFDPKHTDLIIFVYWGETAGANDSGRMNVADNSMEAAAQGSAFSDPGADDQLQQSTMLNALANRQRDDSNAKNAALLGYRDELQRAQDAPTMRFAHDRVAEVEADRYLVVLIAIDYRTIVQTKQKKLLWETKFSIPAQGNGFDAKLAAMAQSASRYFGQDVPHLIRDVVPEGKVEVGTPTVVEPQK